MNWALLSFGFLLWGFQDSLAYERSFPPRGSQVRLPQEDFHMFLERSRAQSVLEGVDRSASGVAVPLDELDFSVTVSWEGVGDLEREFFKVRDERFLILEDQSDFPRRISWLFPDDGCYTRAALAADKLQEWGSPRPSKVFVFGPLEVQTPNAWGGAVTWWYHVVPAVRKGGWIFVFDPAINPRAPMLFKEWISYMADDPEQLYGSVCGTYTYVPESPCFSSEKDEEQGAEEAGKFFLREEWARLIALDRDPFHELGDHPPWLP